MIPAPPTLGSVLTALSREGLTSPIDEADVAKALHDDDVRTGSDTPLYVRALVTAGAWFAGIMLLLLFFVLSGFDSASHYAVVGAVFMGGGVMLSRQPSETYNEFVVQFILVLICAGNALLLAAIGMGFSDSTVLVGGGCIALGLLLLVACDHVQLCTAAVLEVCAGASMIVHDGAVPFVVDVLQGLLGVAMVATWLHEQRWYVDRLSRFYEPISRGLVIAFCAGLFTSLAGDDLETAVGSVTTVTSALLLLWVAREALHSAGTSVTSQTAGLTGLGICGTAAFTFAAPGVMGAALCLGLGLHRRSLWLVGSATVFFCVFMSRFYYQLSIDLLTKSGMLVASGLLLLALSRAAAAPSHGAEEVV
ncbi:MAG: DUF4401 domain-containing protein [Myxococcota bacterium]